MSVALVPDGNQDVLLVWVSYKNILMRSNRHLTSFGQLYGVTTRQTERSQGWIWGHRRSTKSKPDQN